MSDHASIAARAALHRRALHASFVERFPRLCAVPQPTDESAIVLGRDHTGKPLSWSLRARLEHTLVIGTTGAGKTRLIEHAARQDVVDGRAVIVIDPHGSHPGSLYRSFLGWLHKSGYTRSRIIHLIDPNAGSHVTGMNPLARPSEEYEATVIAEAMQEAIERVWGEENMDSKPTMQRTLSAVLTALTELGLTLAEAKLLFDPNDRDGVREWIVANLHNDEAREELEYLHSIASEARGRQEFRQELVGPRNRLAKLTRDAAIRAMVGQQRTIDFRAALDEGHIILANLSPGPRAGDKAMQLVGRLLTRLAFFNTVRRSSPERGAFLYADECQLYLSGDVSRMLAEARKFGLGCVLASQSLASFRIAGDDIVDAVKNMCNTKIALRIKNPEEAEELAEMLFKYDLEMPVRALTKPTVVGHRVIRLRGAGHSEQHAVTDSESRSFGQTKTIGRTFTKGETETAGRSSSVGHTESRGQSQSVGLSYMEGQSETDTYGSSRSNGFSRSSTASASESEGSARSSSQSISSGVSTGRTTSVSVGENVTEQWRPSTWDPEEESEHEEEVRVGLSRGRSTQASISDAISASASRTVGDATNLSRGSMRGRSASEGTSESVSSTQSRAHTASSSLGKSNSVTETSSRARSLTLGETASRGQSLSVGRSSSVGTSLSESDSRARTFGCGTTDSWHEALEPIYEERPTAVHGLENVRYMASTALRSLRSGYAAISYVDAGGLKSAALAVANVDSFALPDRLFDQLRTFVFNRSPSAMRYDEAMANIADRHQKLLSMVQRVRSREPETPAGYRTKRPKKIDEKQPVDLHGEQFAPDRDSVKGQDRRRRRP